MIKLEVLQAAPDNSSLCIWELEQYIVWEVGRGSHKDSYFCVLILLNCQITIFCVIKHENTKKTLVPSGEKQPLKSVYAWTCMCRCMCEFVHVDLGVSAKEKQRGRVFVYSVWVLLC